MDVESKALINSNFYCDEGINMNEISQWFRKEMGYTSVPDGTYRGRIRSVELKKGKSGLRLNVNVLLKDNTGENVLVKYSTQFTPKNYFLMKLFKSFNINLVTNQLNLESLVNVYVEATVKNNGSYCNVTDMIPLTNHQIKEFISPYGSDDLDLELDDLNISSSDEELEDFNFDDEEELD